jgi:hypothetical protein
LSYVAQKRGKLKHVSRKNSDFAKKLSNPFWKTPKIWILFIY